MWACTRCHSLNAARAPRCYKCSLPREAALTTGSLPAAQAAPSSVEAAAPPVASPPFEGSLAAPPSGWVVPPPQAEARSSGCLVIMAAALLAALGILATLAGLLFGLGGLILKTAADQTGVPGLGDLFGGVFGSIALILVVLGVVEVVSAAGVWRGTVWGQVLGLLYGVGGFLLGLASVLDAGSANTGTGTTAGDLILLLSSAFITAVLTQQLAVRWVRRS